MIRPVLEYARWQLRDHLRGAGLVILLFAIAEGLVLWRVRVANPNLPAVADVVLAATLGTMAWPLVVLAVSGIIATDRIEGYNRALFSAPVSPVLYYLQRFVLGGVVVALLPATLALMLRLVLGEWVPVAAETQAVLLLYLLLGGVVFFWSTFGRRDWAIGLSLFLGQRALHDAVAAGMPVPTLLRELVPLLPPFHLVDFGGPGPGGARATLVPAGGELAHFLAYGVGLVVLGAVLLRLRPMGGGTRG